MKNKLREDIKKMAAQILASDVNFDTLKTKTIVTKLQEQLTVLAYLESHLNVSETSALDSKSYREDNWFKEPVPVPRSEHKDALVEPAMEKIKDIVAQMPPESQKVEELLAEILPKSKTVNNDLEDFAANYQQMPTFERKPVEEKLAPPTEEAASVEKQTINTPEKIENKSALINDLGISEKPKSLNDQTISSLKLGLNDRIAFTKHLFDGSADDLQRVLSQINTFTSLDEATTFITMQVKPDYNNWEDKEEFEERFMGLLSKRFN